MTRLEKDQNILDDTLQKEFQIKIYKLMIVEKKIETFDPLGVATQIADEAMWNWERLRPDELIIDVPGHWGEYRFHLNWQEESHLFYLACFLDLKVPDILPEGIYELLVLVNRRLWMGHFDFVEDQWIVFRYSLLMKSKETNDILPQVEELIDTIIGECETFYPVFGTLLTHDIPPEEALQMGLIDTVGEA